MIWYLNSATDWIVTFAMQLRVNTLIIPFSKQIYVEYFTGETCVSHTVEKIKVIVEMRLKKLDELFISCKSSWICRTCPTGCEFKLN